MPFGQSLLNLKKLKKLKNLKKKLKKKGVGLKSSCPVLKKHTLNFKNTVHGL